MSLVDVLQFVNVLAAAILAGGQLFALRVIVPSLHSLPAGTSARLHQVMLVELPHRYLMPAGLLAALSAVGIVLVQHNLATLPTICILAGLLATLGGGLTSALNRRTNLMIAGWPTEAVPAAYPQIRRTWDRRHAVRTLASLLALACYLAAGLAN